MDQDHSLRDASFPLSLTAPLTWVRWQVIALLMALCFISHLNRISISVAANARIMDQYGISPTQMGIVYSAFLLTYTLGMTPGGFFIDRFGPRRALMVVGFGSAVSVLLTGAVGFGLVIGGQVLLMFIIIRAAMGWLTAPLHPSHARIVGNWIPSRRQSTVNGLVASAAALGIACTYPVFGWLVAAVGWPVAFVITGSVTATLALLWMWRAADDPTQHPAIPQATRQLVRDEQVTAQASIAPAGDWKEVLQNRNLILLTLSYAAVDYFQYLFFYWMEFYFSRVLQLKASTSQLYSSFPLLAMAVGMPLGGWLSDRLTQKYGYRIGRGAVAFMAMVAGGAFLGMGIMTKEPGWIVLWFSLALGAIGGTEGIFWVTAVEQGGRRGGMAAGVLNTGGNIGGAFAPVLTPWVSTLYGWPVSIGIGAIIALLGAVCWLWITPARSQRPIATPQAS